MSLICPVGCILFHFYIKPQPGDFANCMDLVVSYSISTSNHNLGLFGQVFFELYLIPFLHQTTTAALHDHRVAQLYLIPFLHQTTTTAKAIIFHLCCILFHFYIKPQLGRRRNYLGLVVSYSISTSNHNVLEVIEYTALVVSYSISTSNHNLFDDRSAPSVVVSYSISTSNHNLYIKEYNVAELYLIPFLHQTTTFDCDAVFRIWLYLIPFLHQTTTKCMAVSSCWLLYLIPFLHQTTTYGA